MPIGYPFDGQYDGIHNRLGMGRGFLPDQIAGLRLWLDAADTNTITADMSGFVSQWDDKSGNGHDGVQLTGASQPRTGASDINGRNVITFDGVNDFLEIPFSALLNTASFTIFIVCKVTGGVGNFRSVFSSRDVGPLSGYFLRAQNDNNWEGFIGTGSGFGGPRNGSRSVVTNESVIVEMNVTNGAQELVINQAIVDTTADNFAVNTLNLTRIGAGETEGPANFFFPGDIGEAILYDSVLISNEKLQGVNYLSNKWGVPLVS